MCQVASSGRTEPEDPLRAQHRIRPGSTLDEPPVIVAVILPLVSVEDPEDLVEFGLIEGDEQRGDRQVSPQSPHPPHRAVLEVRERRLHAAAHHLVSVVNVVRGRRHHDRHRQFLDQPGDCCLDFGLSSLQIVAVGNAHRRVEESGLEACSTSGLQRLSPSPSVLPWPAKADDDVVDLAAGSLQLEQRGWTPNCLVVRVGGQVQDGARDGVVLIGRSGPRACRSGAPSRRRPSPGSLVQPCAGPRTAWWRCGSAPPACRRPRC